MAEMEGADVELGHVLERFPDRAALVRQLVLVDATFASICEDYALASATLARLEALPPAEQAGTEIADYRTLVADLEREIAEALRNAE